MKNRCAGLVVVLFSLSVFGVASADIEFNGVLESGTSVTRYDSIRIVSLMQDMTLHTSGWGSDIPYDTLVFAGVTAWPETLWMHGTINGSPIHNSFPNLKPDSWYCLCLGIVVPKVMYFGDYGGVGESKPVVAPLPRLTVSPSVVTGLMRIRLQPVGAGRPVVLIHDAVGNLVRSLECSAGSDGIATATWNREDESGRLVPEGVYICRYAAADIVVVRKVLITH